MRASDVYSLGVVLFELLTGRVPFEGDNFVAVAMKHINEPAPSVAAHRPDVPPRLAAAVSRALAKNPRDRFASMDEFAAELEACLAEVRFGTDSARTIVNAPVPAAVRSRNVRARRRVTAAPLLVGLLALAALGVIVVALIAVQRDDGGLPGISSAKGGGGDGGANAVSLSAAGTYDPESDGGEHDAEIQNATDHNFATYWTTEHYGSSDFGGLKDGVGPRAERGGEARDADRAERHARLHGGRQGGNVGRSRRSRLRRTDGQREDDLRPERPRRAGLRPVDHQPQPPTASPT